MKKTLFSLILFILLLFLSVLFYPEAKPASEEKIKEVLFLEYQKLKKFGKLEEWVDAIKILENNKSVIKTTIDYTNYLYIRHSVNKIGSLEVNSQNEEHIKRIMLNDEFEYILTIEDAFSDIDPNNFAPN
jgi:hypothetical protein